MSRIRKRGRNHDPLRTLLVHYGKSFHRHHPWLRASAFTTLPVANRVRKSSKLHSTPPAGQPDAQDSKCAIARQPVVRTFGVSLSVDLPIRSRHVPYRVFAIFSIVAPNQRLSLPCKEIDAKSHGLSAAPEVEPCCKQAWLLKNSHSRSSQKFHRARMPYKRRSRFWWTFSIPRRDSFFKRGGFSTATGDYTNNLGQ